MNLQKLILTENACYKAGRKITVKGIMVHSTGANNPWLKRYVGPDDGKLGKNQYNNHWNTYHPGGREVCVHGFIGKLADGSVATYQTLPWDHRGWHAGGSANNTHIGFEICEPKDWETNRDYFGRMWENATDLCVMLCRRYGFTAADITSHVEGYRAGIASNHGDPLHWFPKFGRDMDDFRKDVDTKLKGVTEIMGQYVNRDKLIQWINENSVDIAEETTSQYRTTANLYYHTTYPATAGDTSTRAGKWQKGTLVDVVDGWESAGNGYTWVKVLYDGGTYYAAKEYLEKV